MPRQFAPKGILQRLFSLGSEEGGIPILDPMDAVIALQKADGSWCLDSNLCKALGIDLTDLRSLVPELGGAGAEAAVATAAALAWLKLHAMDREVEWKLLAQKAERWLDVVLAKLVPPLQLGVLVDRAEALLPKNP